MIVSWKWRLDAQRMSKYESGPSYAKTVIVIFLLSLVVVSSSIWLNTPPLGNEYFSLSTLGPGFTAENYYPTNQSVINLREVVNWNVEVYNHMNSVQYVSVRLLIINSSEEAPNGTSGTPSPYPPLFEFRQAINDNQTWNLSLIWSIANASFEQGRVFLYDVKANNLFASNVNAQAIGGRNFRIIIELWRYDTQTNQFLYTWNSGGQVRSVWNEIWFNMTNP